jgi:hypothetical protein
MTDFGWSAKVTFIFEHFPIYFVVGVDFGIKVELENAKTAS